MCSDFEQDRFKEAKWQSCHQACLRNHFFLLLYQLWILKRGVFGLFFRKLFTNHSWSRCECWLALRCPLHFLRSGIGTDSTNTRHFLGHTWRDIFHSPKYKKGMSSAWSTPSPNCKLVTQYRHLLRVSRIGTEDFARQCMVLPLVVLWCVIENSFHFANKHNTH